MDLGLSGRTAVVTGASHGIGRAIAASFAAEGVSVALLARSRDRLEAVAEELRAAGHPGDVIVAPADVRERSEVEAAADTVRERFGRLDILVNNAGNRMRPGRQIAWTDEEWLL